VERHELLRGEPDRSRDLQEVQTVVDDLDLADPRNLVRGVLAELQRAPDGRLELAPAPRARCVSAHDEGGRLADDRILDTFHREERAAQSRAAADVLGPRLAERDPKGLGAEGLEVGHEEV
jgi:hypothetical protein